MSSWKQHTDCNFFPERAEKSMVKEDMRGDSKEKRSKRLILILPLNSDYGQELIRDF